jgi:predicted metalloendopeptidase
MESQSGNGNLLQGTQNKEFTFDEGNPTVLRLHYDGWDTGDKALAWDEALAYLNLKGYSNLSPVHALITHENQRGNDSSQDKTYINSDEATNINITASYYNPTTNEICFPAGILQYPFFDMEADDAFNYGAIGVVIAHEVTHGFDDMGSNFDKDGNYANWWTEEDKARFNERTKVMEEYFNGIKVNETMYANGKMSLGENIADHGGLQVAFHAFKNATKENPLPVKDGFTPEQRFFLAYANVWAGNITEEEIVNRTLTDVHSLGKWRVNGALPHIAAWYEAFGITENDALYLAPEKRVSIW